MNKKVSVETSIVMSKDEVAAVLRKHLTLMGALTPEEANRAGLLIGDGTFKFIYATQVSSEVPLFKGKESN